MPRINLSTGTPAEFVRPSDAPVERALVIFPDIMGLRPLFDDHVSRLASTLGWPVAAIEPFPGQESLTLEERLETVGTLDDDAKLGDLQAAAGLLGAEQVCILGFCMGGMYASKFAPHFFRAVSFYGMIRVPERWRSEGHAEPLQILAKTGADNLMAIIGTADVWTPPADVEALKATGATVVVYEGAEHGFAHDPDRPAHRPQDAADAWRRAEQFLAAG